MVLRGKTSRPKTIASSNKISLQWALVMELVEAEGEELERGERGEQVREVEAVELKAAEGKTEETGSRVSPDEIFSEQGFLGARGSQDESFSVEMKATTRVRSLQGVDASCFHK